MFLAASWKRRARATAESFARLHSQSSSELGLSENQATLRTASAANDTANDKIQSTWNNKFRLLDLLRHSYNIFQIKIKTLSIIIGTIKTLPHFI